MQAKPVVNALRILTGTAVLQCGAAAKRARGSGGLALPRLGVGGGSPPGAADAAGSFVRVSYLGLDGKDAVWKLPDEYGAHRP